MSKAFVIQFPYSPVFTAFQYPGGEVQVRINKDFLEVLRVAPTIEIYVRVQSTHDLITLILLSDAISGWTAKPQVLHIPYLPYARADRRFVYGDCNGLQTLGRILNAGSFSKVITLDVHSGQAFDYVAGLVNEDPFDYIHKAVARIQSQYHWEVQILLPDEGASKRYMVLPGLTPALTCTKKRDPETGKLSGFEVPEIPLGVPVLIIDDICDGGGTFLGIAEKIHHSNPLYLYVSHGLFSKGFKALMEHFETIFTTDSINAISPAVNFVEILKR